jgi:hypothetical protein
MALKQHATLPAFLPHSTENEDKCMKMEAVYFTETSLIICWTS